jgi:hypothetical protein
VGESPHSRLSLEGDPDGGDRQQALNVQFRALRNRGGVDV